MKTQTVLAKLVAKQSDSGGYLTYVFELIENDEKERLGCKYVMCTQFPNWDHREVQVGESGYLQFQEIIAGVDKWFDGVQMIKYRYDMVQFIRFISRPIKKDFIYKLD